MATIYTRATKGSALTWTEGDANITNLNTAKIENVVEDTTPQLGGNLDVNGNSIVSTSNGNIAITPNGTGSVVLDGLNWPQADGTNNQVLTTNGSGQLSFSTVSGGATNLDGLSDVVITSAATNDVLVYNGTNWVDTAANTLTVSAASTATTATGATNINISTTNGNTSDSTLYPVLVGAAATGNQLPHIDTGAFSYDASTDTLNIGTSGSISGKIFLESSGGGDVSIQAGATATSTTFIFPVTTGTTQQLLTTNGSGQASWASSLTGGFTFNSNTANTQKLTIGPGSLSSTAWTTNGVGLRIQAAQYTDTSSTAGTVANSHVHAIAAPTMASTNAITITDAGTLYISGAPNTGSNTTITNGWALLANGPIKATSFSGSGANLTSIPNGALTNSAITFGATSTSLGGTVSALNSVSIGATTASTGTFTTLTVNAANELRLADTDSTHYVGFKAPATVTTNRVWTLPAADGTSGQLLSTNGSGVLSWATDASGGGSGPSFALVYLSDDGFVVSNTASNANLFGVATLVEDYDANNILSINGDNDIVLAAAGTYIYEILSASLFATNYGPGTASTALTSPTAFFNIYNSTTASIIAYQDLNSHRHPGNGNSITYRSNLGALQIRTKIVTTTSNNVIRVRVTGASASSGGSAMSFSGPRSITIKVTKLA
jgi:hypothetical protein